MDHQRKTEETKRGPSCRTSEFSGLADVETMHSPGHVENLSASDSIAPESDRYGKLIKYTINACSDIVYKDPALKCSHQVSYQDLYQYIMERCKTEFERPHLKSVEAIKAYNPQKYLENVLELQGTIKKLKENMIVSKYASLLESRKQYFLLVGQPDAPPKADKPFDDNMAMKERRIRSIIESIIFISGDFTNTLEFIKKNRKEDSKKMAENRLKVLGEVDSVVFKGPPEQTINFSLLHMMDILHMTAQYVYEIPAVNDQLKKITNVCVDFYRQTPKVEEYLRTLKDDENYAKGKLEEAKQSVKDKTDQLDQQKAKLAKMEASIDAAENKRKQLLKRLNSAAQTFTVYARLAPALDSICSTYRSDKIIVSSQRASADTDNSARCYILDRAFGTEATNQTVYNNGMKPLIGLVTQGQIVHFTAIGALGSGKTHSLFGDASTHTTGLLDLALNDLSNNKLEILSHAICLDDSIVNMMQTENQEVLPAMKDIMTPTANYVAMKSTDIQTVSTSIRNWLLKNQSNVKLIIISIFVANGNSLGRLFLCDMVDYKTDEVESGFKEFTQIMDPVIDALRRGERSTNWNMSNSNYDQMLKLILRCVNSCLLFCVLPTAANRENINGTLNFAKALNELCPERALPINVKKVSSDCASTMTR